MRLRTSSGEKQGSGSLRQPCLVYGSTSSSGSVCAIRSNPLLQLSFHPYYQVCCTSYQFRYHTAEIGLIHLKLKHTYLYAFCLCPLQKICPKCASPLSYQVPKIHISTMSLSVTEPSSSSGFTKLELRTAHGPVYREVSNAPPRNCRADEIPIIDLSLMFGDLDSRTTLSATIVEEAEDTGFFYIKDHGISGDLIQATYRQAQAFFKQPESQKEKVSKERSQYFNGWHKRQNTRSSPSESPDTMEQFSWRYDPKYDPETKDSDYIPENVKSGLQCEDFIWEGTEQIPNFREQCIGYWQENLTLARRLIKLFAIGLGLPENYFDSVTTYSGR